MGARPFPRGPGAAPVRNRTIAALLRWWWRQPFEYEWVHAYAESHAWLRVDRMLVSASYGLFAALGVALLVGGRPGPLVIACTGAGIVAFAVSAWWWWADHPWPTERASLCCTAIGELCGVTLAAAAPSGEVALALMSLYVLPGTYVMFLHGPRTLLAHHVWVVAVVLGTGGYLLAVTDIDPTTALTLMAVQVFVCCGGLTAGHIALTFLRADARNSFTDSLTGLLNRRGMREAVAHSTTRYRPGAPVSVLMVDVDKFKPLNDSHGHHEGDALLVALGGVLGAICDDHADAIARIGGDEFVAVTHLDADAAADIGDQVRVAVATLPVDASVTVSVGVHTEILDSWPPTEAVFAALLARADEALYVTKRDGGNAVTSTLGRPGEI